MAWVLKPSLTVSYQVSTLRPGENFQFWTPIPYHKLFLAKLIEDKVKDSKPRQTRPPPYTTVFNPINTPTSRAQTTPNTLPIKRLTPT